MLLLALAGLLVNALDCYGAWLTSRQARKCCGSGHCSASNLDSCCKNAATGSTQALEAASKNSVQRPMLSMAAPSVEMILLAVIPVSTADESHPPPLDLPKDNFPLLI